MIMLNGNGSEPFMQMYCSFATAGTAFNWLFGLPANTYMLWLITTTSGNSETFTLNLAVSEIVASVASLFIICTCYWTGENIENILTFVSPFIVISRPLFQTCICVERYLAVLHPVVFVRFRPLRYRLACSTLAWLFLLCLCVVTYVLSDQKVVVMSAINLLFFLVMAYSSFMVLRALLNSRPGERGRDRERPDQAKMKAFKIILVLLVNMVITSIPLLATLAYLPLSKPKAHLTMHVYLSVTILSGLIYLLYFYRAGKLSCMTCNSAI